MSRVISFRNLPNWAACFLLAALVVGLQLTPITGVFLMVLVAPYWSVILINLGFGLMLRDAALPGSPKWLFIPPLVWFGGYLVAAGVSHWQANRFVTEIEAANAGKHVPFDPAQQDLFLELDSHDENNGSPLRADELIRSYGVTDVFERSIDFRGNVYNRSFLLVGMACPRGGPKSNFDGSFTQFRPVSFIVDQRTMTARDLCIIYGSRTPQRPIVHIKPQPQVTSRSKMSATQDIYIEAADGSKVTLRSGWAMPLSWLPQPIIGCALNSASPKWECFATFARQSLYDPKSDHMPASAEKVVAKSLGLKKLSLRER